MVSMSILKDMCLKLFVIHTSIYCSDICVIVVKFCHGVSFNNRNMITILQFEVLFHIYPSPLGANFILFG